MCFSNFVMPKCSLFIPTTRGIRFLIWEGNNTNSILSFSALSHIYSCRDCHVMKLSVAAKKMANSDIHKITEKFNTYLFLSKLTSVFIGNTLLTSGTDERLQKTTLKFLLYPKHAILCCIPCPYSRLPPPPTSAIL